MMILVILMTTSWNCVQPLLATFTREPSIDFMERLQINVLAACNSGLLACVDIYCYSPEKVNSILSHNGSNHLIKQEIPCETDLVIHVYTFILPLNATYNILIIAMSLYNCRWAHTSVNLPPPEAIVSTEDTMGVKPYGSRLDTSSSPCDDLIRIGNEQDR